MGITAPVERWKDRRRSIMQNASCGLGTDGIFPVVDNQPILQRGKTEAQKEASSPR